MQSKKLVLQNCSTNSSSLGRCDKEEWDAWLKIVHNFFNCYKTASILNDKPLKDTRPYVNIKINDITASGLLDSGSTVTIIGNNAYNALLSRGLKLCTDDKISVVTAGGQTLQSIGYLNLPVHFENQFHIVKTYIVPGVTSSLILGINFWQAFQLCPKYLGS